MKRYLLFAGDTYYPGGGWDDFQGAFDHVDEARAAVKQDSWEGGHWWHIIDTETMKEVE